MGDVVRRTGARKNIARAADLSPQRISQLLHGDPTGDPQRWAEWLEKQARGGSVDPWPYVTASIGLLTEIECEGCTDPWPELHEVMDDEAERQAQEDVAWHRLVYARLQGDPDEIRDAAQRFVAAAELEMDRQARAVGLTRVLLRRLG